MKPKKIIQTAMLNRYWMKLALRIGIFVAFLLLYINDKDFLYHVLNREFNVSFINHGFTPIHFLWFIFMVMMLSHLVPSKVKSMALEKGWRENFQEAEGYSKLDLLKYVQDQNIKAWKVMLIWLSFNAIFGFLYLFEVIDNVDLLMRDFLRDSGVSQIRHFNVQIVRTKPVR